MSKVNQVKNKADFDILLRAAAAEDDTEASPRIIVTASSDSIDLATDRFTLSALKQMQTSFPGMTIFLNHQYKVPDDVFGKVDSANLVKREGNTDLDLVIDVEKNNPRAMTTYGMIKDGNRLGVSVGVIVLEAEYTDEEVAGKKVLQITSVHPLEASVVGIPANRRSWVHGALKAASAFVLKDMLPLLDFDTITRLQGSNDGEDGSVEDDDEAETLEASAAEASDDESGGDDAALQPADIGSDEQLAEVDAALAEHVEVAEADESTTAEAETEVDAEAETEALSVAAAYATEMRGQMSFMDFIESKGLREQVVASAIFDAIYSASWNFIFSVYRLFQMDEIDLKNKRKEMETLLAEFSAVNLELWDAIAKLGPKGQKMSEQEFTERYFHDGKFIKSASDTDGDDSIDMAEVFTAVAAATEAVENSKQLVEEVATLRAALHDKDGQITQLFDALTAIMDAPLPRKINPLSVEETASDRVSKHFPMLHPNVVKMLEARSGGPN